MEVSQYWVGQIPSRAMAIRVLDGDGAPRDCSHYNGYYIRLIGSDNEEIPLLGGNLAAVNADLGEFIFTWPRVSVFNKVGEYVLQMVLIGSGNMDMTSLHTIRVRDPRMVRK